MDQEKLNEIMKRISDVLESEKLTVEQGIALLFQMCFIALNSVYGIEDAYRDIGEMNLTMYVESKKRALDAK